MSFLKKFIAIYFISLVLMELAWLAFPELPIGLLPGDTQFVVSDFSIMAAFGSALATTAVITPILAFFQR